MLPTVPNHLKRLIVVFVVRLDLGITANAARLLGDLTAFHIYVQIRPAVHVLALLGCWLSGYPEYPHRLCMVQKAIALPRRTHRASALGAGFMVFRGNSLSEVPHVEHLIKSRAPAVLKHHEYPMGV